MKERTRKIKLTAHDQGINLVMDRRMAETPIG
jgi:hypothetical protein